MSGRTMYIIRRVRDGKVRTDQHMRDVCGFWCDDERDAELFTRRDATEFIGDDADDFRAEVA